MTALPAEAGVLRSEIADALAGITGIAGADAAAESAKRRESR